MNILFYLVEIKTSCIVWLTKYRSNETGLGMGTTMLSSSCGNLNVGNWDLMLRYQITLSGRCQYVLFFYSDSVHMIRKEL